jgi:hypothetical protein
MSAALILQISPRRQPPCQQRQPDRGPHVLARAVGELLDLLERQVERLGVGSLGLALDEAAVICADRALIPGQREGLFQGRQAPVDRAGRVVPGHVALDEVGDNANFGGPLALYPGPYAQRVIDRRLRAPERLAVLDVAAHQDCEQRVAVGRRGAGLGALAQLGRDLRQQLAL